MNSEELLLLIKEADNVGQVPLIKGLHGIGKTECVGKYADDTDLHLEPLILSLMDTGDLLGMPETSQIGGLSATVWSAPDWYVNVVNYAWPTVLDTDALVFNDTGLEHFFREDKNLLWASQVTRDEVNEAYREYYNLPDGYLHILKQDVLQYSKGKRSVVFLDEINRSQPDIQDASLQFILEKRLHSHILPRVMGKDTLIVAAINPSGAQYNVSEFDPALLDRFVECNLELDFPAWKRWAKSNDVCNVVIDFLSNNSNYFHFTPNEGKGTSPRTWVKMSDYLKSIKGTSENGFHHYTIGRLGITAAIAFETFYDTYQNTMTVEQLEKRICGMLRKEGGSPDLEKLAEELSTDVAKLDNTQLLSYTEYFKQNYLSGSAKVANPLLVFLYSLPLEVLSTVLKENKKNIEDHRMLESADREANNCNLFLKLTRHLRNGN